MLPVLQTNVTIKYHYDNIRRFFAPETPLIDYSNSRNKVY